MNEHAVTHNLAEALHLYGRSHRVVKVETVRAGHGGFAEFEFTFEGEGVVDDHWDYFGRLIEPDLRKLPKLFRAIAAVLPKGGAS